MAPPKHPWFRMYCEVVSDRKIRRLTPAQRWLWVAVLASARQSPEPGTLLIAEGVPVTIDDLAELAGVKLSEARTGVARMLELGLLDGADPWVVPKWGQRQFESDTSTPRTRRHRSGNAEATPMERPMERSGIGPEAEAEAEAETEPTNGCTPAAARTGGDRRRRFEDAAAVIGERAALRDGVRNPAATARAVARAVVTDRHHDAYAHLAVDPTLTADALAELLEPSTPPAPVRTLPPASAPETIADLEHHAPARIPDDIAQQGRSTVVELRQRFQPRDPGDPAA